MRILLTFIAVLPSIIATPAFPDSQVTESGTNGITTPKDNFKPFGDQPFGDQPFGDQPFGVWPWDSEEADPRTAPNDPINIPLPQDSGDEGIYAPPTGPWNCPPDRPIPLCCDGKSYNGGVETGCSECVCFNSPQKIISNLLLLPPHFRFLQITDLLMGGPAQGMGNFPNVT